MISSKKNNIFKVAGSVLFFLGVAAVFCLEQVNLNYFSLLFVLFYYLKVLRRKEEPNYLSLGLLLVLSFACLYFTRKFAVVPYISSIFFLVILVNVLFSDWEFSLVYLLSVSLLNGFIKGYDFRLFFVFFVSGCLGIFLSRNVRRRLDIIQSGVLSGIAEFTLVICLFPGFSLTEAGQVFKFCFFSGIIPSVILIIIPIFEYLFGAISNISLLELSDFNHPLLRKMILEAPGTYQHSLVVANLAEIAAESIGANSLLARAGAYYHDIGKISKAEYFAENQMLAGYKDRHKNLSPSMSKMIIMNHVKEGIELAKKYRLNKKIINFIAQHHGTTLVYYFFRRAKEINPENSGSEEIYRYPGPKPNSKEVALVHLADTVEASSRVLEDPTPARIKEMVKQSIMNKFLDGQLDNTDLTLRDLEKTAEVFVRVLNAMFHTRVDYFKDADENSHNQPSKPTANTEESP